MKTHLIGLTGLAFVGKDTVADLLVTHAGFIKLAFADALRGEISEGFGVDLELLTQRHTKETPTPQLAISRGPATFRNAVFLAHALEQKVTRDSFPDWFNQPRTPREIMQLWGTEYRRAQSVDYWVKQLQGRVEYGLRNGQHRLVISDCRFSNEVEYLRQRRGHLWQITGNGVTPPATPEIHHVSVTTGAEFAPALTLRNDHDIRHLQGLVRDAFCATQWSASA